MAYKQILHGFIKNKNMWKCRENIVELHVFLNLFMLYRNNIRLLCVQWCTKNLWTWTQTLSIRSYSTRSELLRIALEYNRIQVRSGENWEKRLEEKPLLYC